MYNYLNFMGIGNIFSGVCNTYTNYYGGYGYGCGCGSVFNYKSAMGFTAGMITAPIVGMLTYKGIKNHIETKKANSVDTLNEKINEILARNNITDPKDMAKVQPGPKYTEAVTDAEKKVTECKTAYTEAQNEVSKIKQQMEKMTVGSDEYTKAQSQLITAQNTEKQTKAELDAANEEEKQAKADLKAEAAAIEKDKIELERLIKQRDEKQAEDAEGKSLFRTSKDNLDKKFGLATEEKESKETENTPEKPDYSKATKQDIKGAFHAYNQAKTGSPEQKKYRDAFLAMYTAYNNEKHVKQLGSDLDAVYKLLKAEAEAEEA